jgi:glyceraldehyde-3-phosphate dehydrogenase (NAD(P))/S-adenosylmethionine synthetase
LVERKAHPDSICDGIAERVCVRLGRYRLDRFDVILHHNVDKVLLSRIRATGFGRWEGD